MQNKIVFLLKYAGVLRKHMKFKLYATPLTNEP